MHVHRVSVIVDVRTGGTPVALAVEHAIRSADRSADVLRHRQGQVDLDAVATIQHNGSISVTVCLLRVDQDEGADEEVALDAWSTTIPPEGSAGFRLTVCLPDDAVAVAEGAIAHTCTADGP